MDLGGFFKRVLIGLGILLGAVVFMIGGILLIKEGNMFGILCIIISIFFVVCGVFQIVCEIKGKTFLIR